MTRHRYGDFDYRGELRRTVTLVDARFWLDDAGRMAEFSASRWSNYRAQFGTIRRSGDDRIPVSSFTWMESFADRMETEGLLV